MKTNFVIHLIVVVILFFSINSEATVVRMLSLQKMCKKASGIIIGDVISVDSYWNTKHIQILTKVTINVSENLGNNNISKKIHLIQPGGTVGSVTLKVSGLPQFVVNEKVLVFLEYKFQGHYVVMGLAQGKYTIIKNRDNNDEFATRDLRGLIFINNNQIDPSLIPNSIETIPLRNLRKQIKSILNMR